MKTKTEAEYNFFWTYLTEHGLTDDEATEALRLDSICRLDTPRRIYNDLKKEKDREKQEDMRKTFSPNTDQRSCYKIARKLRMEKETNHQLW
jgi:hypothetical protein